jgi:hypothetical protein
MSQNRIAEAARNKNKAARPLVVLGCLVLCAVALLVRAAVSLWMIGPFIGDEMLGAAGLVILYGGLLFESPST